jgi:hypothetical protein
MHQQEQSLELVVGTVAALVPTELVMGLEAVEAAHQIFESVQMHLSPISAHSLIVL